MASTLLGPMRKALTTADKEDGSAMVKQCRAWLREDRKGFLSKLAEIEAKQKFLDAEGKESPGVPDGGEEKCLELLERVLLELREQPNSCP